MTDTFKLETEIRRSELTKKEVAKKLGLSDMGLYKKIKGITEFRASEIMALSEMLDIKNKDEIFFAEKVI